MDNIHTYIQICSPSELVAEGMQTSLNSSKCAVYNKYTNCPLFVWKYALLECVQLQ